MREFKYYGKEEKIALLEFYVRDLYHCNISTKTSLFPRAEGDVDKVLSAVMLGSRAAIDEGKRPADVLNNVNRQNADDFMSRAYFDEPSVGQFLNILETARKAWVMKIEHVPENVEKQIKGMPQPGRK